MDKVVYIYSDILGFTSGTNHFFRFVTPLYIAYFLGSCLKIVQNLGKCAVNEMLYLYVYPVTNETKWDKVPNVPLEEMGTNHPLSINKGFVSCWFVSLSLFCFVKGN